LIDWLIDWLIDLLLSLRLLTFFTGSCSKFDWFTGFLLVGDFVGLLSKYFPRNGSVVYFGEHCGVKGCRGTLFYPLRFVFYKKHSCRPFFLSDWVELFFSDCCELFYEIVFGDAVLVIITNEIFDKTVFRDRMILVATFFLQFFFQ